MAAAKMDVYQEVTDKFLTALENKIIPWRKPFSIPGGEHRNLATGRVYSGVNPWLLEFSAAANGFTSPYWVGFGQAQKLGGAKIDPATGKQKFHVFRGRKILHWNGGVKKGEKGTLITFRKVIVKNEGTPNEEKYFLLKHHYVFNVEQCYGFEDKIPAPVEPTEFDPIAAADAIVAGMPNPPTIAHGNNGAYYAPALDHVQMPKQENFEGNTAYYSTLFHELSHSTGHSSRLSREGVTGNIRFGSGDYSNEELIAELSAAFLNAHAGILDERQIENQAAYIDHWRAKLSREPKLIVQAASKAQKAADYILGIDRAAEYKEENKDTE
jgi:antirestriction protein ArdC